MMGLSFRHAVEEMKPCQHVSVWERMQPLLKSAVLGLIVACCLFALGGNATTQQHRWEHPLPDTSNGLRLSIALDQPAYRLTEAATVTIKLTNVSQAPITIYKEFGYGWSSSFFWVVADKRGRM